MSTDMQAARTAMINSQLKPNEVNDPAVLAAFAAVPREDFITKSKRGIAYVDEDLEVATGRYLMEPITLGRLLVAANIQKSDLVLDIGPATGYSSAVLSHLAEAVVSVEQDEALAEKAENSLGSLEIMNAAVVTGALNEGKADQGPYDVIMLQGSVDEVPASLQNQLKEGGRLLCVKMRGSVGRAHMIVRENNVFAARDLFDANVMPLPGFAAASSFVF